MKIQIIYSSLSGRTKKLATGIFNGLDIDGGDIKTIHDLKDGEPVLDGDIILCGYWVDKGGPNEEMKAFLPKIKNKAVGIFCTLGFYADSAHGVGSANAGIDLVKENNTVIGSFVGNGCLSDAIIASFRKAAPGSHHSASPQNEIRWEIMKDHPTDAEIALAAERFSERVLMYKKHQEQNLEFRSIL